MHGAPMADVEQHRLDSDLRQQCVDSPQTKLATNELVASATGPGHDQAENIPEVLLQHDELSGRQADEILTSGSAGTNDNCSPGPDQFVGARPHVMIRRPHAPPEKVKLRTGHVPARVQPPALQYETRQDGFWTSAVSTRATTATSCSSHSAHTERRKPPRLRLAPQTLLEHMQGRANTETMTASGRPRSSPVAELKPAEWSDFPNFTGVLKGDLDHESQLIPAPPDTPLNTRRIKTAPPPQKPVLRDDTIQRLATPRKGGASDRTKKRTLSKEYEVYAHQAATSLLPGVAAPDAVTKTSSIGGRHTAEGDGYRSAIFHAAVRCRELLNSVGMHESEGNGTFAFKGQDGQAAGGLPDLERLQQACVLFEELCRVSSPLRDTLRFIFCELMSCIFVGYKSGDDVMMLTPFFALRQQEVKEVQRDRKRAQDLEEECDTRKERLDRYQHQVGLLKDQIERERKKTLHENESYEMVVAQRNELRQKIDGLRESNSIRHDELRETTAELTAVQASSYLVVKELDQTKKAMAILNSKLKESESKCSTLMHRTMDLQQALSLVGDSEAIQRASTAAAIHAGGFSGGQIHSLELPPELEMELILLTQRGGRGRLNAGRRRERGIGEHLEKAAESVSVVDGNRILRAALPDGNWQVVLKGTADDPKGLQPADTPGLPAAAAGGHRASRGSAAPPVLILSGEAFAALSIGQSLPMPPDPLQYTDKDDEGLLEEVTQEVHNLTEEYSMLIELYRGLRQDMKRMLRLVPDWNRDELQGMLCNVLCFDKEEQGLVPQPASQSNHVIGLGEGNEVPPFLRYVGLLAVRSYSEDEVARICQDIWQEKTERFLQEDAAGRPIMSLGNFLNDIYLPTQANARPVQMELMYNFLLELRKYTSLAGVKGESQIDVLTQSSLARRKSRAFNKGSAGDKVLELVDECPNCGNHYQADSLFCRKCRTKRPGAEKLARQTEVCFNCGSVFMPDAKFCRRCGNPREEQQAVEAKKRREDKTTEQFEASAEILYRGLLKEVHEDFFHDASTMLVNLGCCMVAMMHRFAPVTFKDAACVGEDRPLEMSLSVVSAVLRLFFPNKPREHLSALKQIMNAEVEKAAAQWRATETPQASEGDGDDMEEKLQPILVEKKVPDVNLKELLCLPAVEANGSFKGGNVALLHNLLRQPSSLILELRRQHFAECMSFLDKFQKALKANHRRSNLPTTGSGGAPSTDITLPPSEKRDAIPESAHLVTAKGVIDALVNADKDLTQDQRNLYLLRGFGRRLPDMPSVALAEATSSEKTSGEAVAAASRVAKIRKMLQDYCNELVDSGSSVAIDKFVKRLLSSGVIKGGRHWQPEFTCEDVSKASGIASLAQNSSFWKGGLEDFMQAHAASGGPEDSRASRHRAGSDIPVRAMDTAAAEETNQPASSRSGRLMPPHLPQRQASQTSIRSSSPAPMSPQSNRLEASASNASLVSTLQEDAEPFERYCFFARVARDIQELSIGYPVLYLSYWVNRR